MMRCHKILQQYEWAQVPDYGTLGKVQINVTIGEKQMFINGLVEPCNILF